MPSKRNPVNIRVGSGLAGRGSVAVTSVTFSTGSAGSTTRASEVINETPIQLSGDNVQEHINQVALQAPTPLPNQIGETSNPLNSGAVDTNPASVAGLFGAGATAAALVDNTNVTIEGIIFPADRGILVLEADGVEVAALDLNSVFVEGTTEDTSAPTRGIGQNDYVAGSNPNGTVSALPQFGLRDRLPVSASYGGTYDDYPQDFPGQQLATFTVTVTQTADTLVDYDVIHYRSVRDYDAKALGRKYGEADVPTGPALDVYVDGTAGAPTAAAFALTPGDTASLGAKNLSGLEVYDPAVDALETSYTVNGLFANSFLERGITILQQPGQTDNQLEIIHTDYDGGNPVAGQVASFSGVITFPGFKSVELDPVLVASNPFGATSSLTSTTPEILLMNGLAFDTRGSVPVARLTTETFKDEAARYQAGNVLMEPDGTGSTFDSTVDLSAGEAQVRPVSVGGDLDLAEGGELGYPQTDYSTGYFPLNTADYSAFAGAARYYRSFDMGGPYREGRFRIVGIPVSANIFEDFRWDGTVNTAVNDFGHPEGLRIDINTNPTVAPDIDLGRPYGQGGALTGFTIESANSVVVDFLLDEAPELSPEGFYPVRMGVTWTGNAGTAVVLYKIELLPAQ